MKTSIIAILSVSNVLSFGDAFVSVSNKNLKHHVLFASPLPNNEGTNLEKKNEHNKPLLLPNIAGFATALVLGWGVASSASVAASINPSLDYSFMSTTSSSMTVAALDKVSDSEIADFSLPSYGAVVAAEKNSNLKGKTNLLGEEYTKQGSVSEKPKEKAVLSAKETKVAEQSAKDEKAARKAEMKAARERQMAEAEAALK